MSGIAITLQDASPACVFAFTVYDNSYKPCTDKTLTDLAASACYCKVNPDSIPTYCQNDSPAIWQSIYQSFIDGRKLQCDVIKTDVKAYPVETLPADISVAGTSIGAGAGFPVQTGTSTSTVTVIAPALTSTKAGTIQTVTTTKSGAYTLSVGFIAATVSFMIF
ncbi:hypothetical protein HDU79_011781 [Rhizoclosmatium sp. JEL0117]|nr:hypothetical protein HDU79_011781 [Rhizoclosmatium sp. JEL0117]